MNQQKPELQVKRKRGRPRKDESVPRTEKRPTLVPTPLAPAVAPPPPPPVTTTILHQPPPPPATTNANKVDHTMMGQVVTGVIDGVFDAGYLLSVRVGPTNAPLRGVVFLQGHFSPVTPQNDVAPHVKMCTRGEFQVPIHNPILPVPMQNYQTTPPGASSSTCVPHANLRMIEQDEIMQVFEVSKNNHVGSDPTAENNDLNSESLKAAPVIPQASEFVHQERPEIAQNEVKQNSVHNDQSLEVTEVDSVVNKSSPIPQPQKEPEGQNLEIHGETVMESQPSPGKDDLQQENEEQQGEVSKVDINQDPIQATADDLPQSKVSESETN